MSKHLSKRTFAGVVVALSAIATVFAITTTADAYHGSPALVFTDASDAQLNYLVIPNVGDARQIRVGVHDIGADSADTVQIKIVHDPAIVSITSPSCIGIYAGGFGTTVPVDIDGVASGLLCAITNGPLADSGAIVEFTLTRTGLGDIDLSFSSEQPLRTTFFESGASVEVDGSGLLAVLTDTPPAITFSSSTVTLDNIADSAVVTINANNLGVGAADTLQANIVHDNAVIQISNPQCVGIYAGGSVTPAVRVDGDSATAFGCGLANGPAAAGGPAMTFMVTRLAIGEPLLLIGTVGPFQTAFIQAGNVMPTGTPTGFQILANHAPFTNDLTDTTTEDAALALNLLVGDDNGDPLTFQFDLTGLSGALSGVAPDITYTPGQDFNGIDLFTFSVSDDQGAASATSTVTITVLSVNDAPTFSKGNDVAVLENSGAHSTSSWATGVDAGAADESGQALTFVVTNDNNSLFLTQPSLGVTGDLTYELASGTNGVAIVTLQLFDNGGTANGGVDAGPVESFTITVTAVFDVTGAVSLQGAVTVSAVTAIGAQVTLTPVGGGPDYATVAIAADGTFAFVGVPAGTYRIVADANGYQAAERPAQDVLVVSVVMPAVELLGGLVNNVDTVVDGADVSLVMDNFGTTTGDRTDGTPGNWVDINGDGAVSALDISVVMSNLALSDVQAW